MKTRDINQKKIETAALDALYEAILLLKNKTEMKQFFEDLCTPAERESLADRWRVVPAIMAGLSYRSIAQDTGVSVTTIGRVARSLMSGQGGYQLIYERTLQNLPHSPLER